MPITELGLRSLLTKLKKVLAAATVPPPIAPASAGSEKKSDGSRQPKAAAKAKADKVEK